MTTEQARDRMAKARAAKAEKDGRLERLEKLLGDFIAQSQAQTKQLTERIEAVAQTASSTKLLRTAGPEGDLEAYLRDMQRGEYREGTRVTDFLDPNPDAAFQPNDIVRIREDLNGTGKADLQHKVKAYRATLKLDPAIPLLGKVLQLIGPTKQRRGPRKYKVHVRGIGRDGFTHDELELVKPAS